MVMTRQEMIEFVLKSKAEAFRYGDLNVITSKADAIADLQNMEDWEVDEDEEPEQPEILEVTYMIGDNADDFAFLYPDGGLGHDPREAMRYFSYLDALKKANSLGNWAYVVVD